MWQAIGDDSWVVVPIQSAARPGHTVEGTRLTLVCTSVGRLCSLLPQLHLCATMARLLDRRCLALPVAALPFHMSCTMLTTSVGLAWLQYGWLWLWHHDNLFSWLQHFLLQSLHGPLMLTSCR